MPDITMCTNDDCHLNGWCYRYLAPPDTMQSYMFMEPDEDGFCKFFIIIFPEKREANKMIEKREAKK